MELLRFYSAKDLRELAKSAGQAVHLPPDFQLSYELLRGMQHEHWAMRQVQGMSTHCLKACALKGAMSCAAGVAHNVHPCVLNTIFVVVVVAAHAIQLSKVHKALTCSRRPRTVYLKPTCCQPCDSICVSTVAAAAMTAQASSS